ncbi:MAG: DUF6702 family protein [Pseudomonadota bacterium]
MIRRTFLAFAWAACALAFSEASAHRQKASLTEVLFNSRTGNIEVAHRFVLHDAEHATHLKFGSNSDLLGSVETRTTFAEYVSENFEIAGQEGTPLPLITLGSEIKGGHLWIYQETPIIEGLDRLWIRHEALRDIWPEQINRVNLKRNGVVKSLIFTGAIGELEAEFSPEIDTQAVR